VTGSGPRPRTRVRRLRERQVEDRDVLESLLDEALIAHVAIVVDGHPLVLPTSFARDGDRLLLHGSTGSGWMRTAASGVPACVAVSALDGLVVARSAFESSMRYRSAVLFGVLGALAGDDRNRALDIITDKLLPGRRAEVRAPTAREQGQTLVLAMPIEHWSLKVSEGWPDDPEEDRAGPAWAGVVPLRTAARSPIPALDLADGIPIPASVQAFVRARE
jgi:nitroimidazol reductase NimA-like FMN-containing flavoprotein (pyridoxamine 5'-phosphate oxidase superfamily)